MDKFKKPFVTLNMGIGHETYLESLFFPRDIRETYSQNRIFVGWRREYTWERFGTKGRWYTSNKKEGKRTYLDTSKSFRALILGETGCVHGDTKVLTSIGYVMIKHLPKIFSLISYSLKNKKLESDIAIKISSGKKKLLKITTESGEMIVTGDHKILTKNGWIKAANLKVNDKIIKINI